MPIEQEKTTIRLQLLPCPQGDSGRIQRCLAAAGLTVGDQGADCLLWPEDAYLTSPRTLRTLLESPEGWDAVLPLCRGKQGWPVLLRGHTAEKPFACTDPSQLSACIGQAGLRRGFVQVEDFLCTRRAETPEDLALMEIYSRVPYRGVPDAAACRALLAEQGTLPHIVRHCEKTAQVAVELAQSLRAGGYELDVDLVRAGALLHDVLRLTPPHAMRGALLLAERGWFETAEVVRWHMDLPQGQEAEVNETSVVFLADKLAMEDRRVSLRRRHENSCTKSQDEEMRAYIWRRFQVARITEKAIAKALELDGDTL